MEDSMSFQELQEIVSVCLDEIVQLKQDKEELQKQISGMTTTIDNLVKSQKTMLTNMEKTNNDIALNLLLLNNGMNNVKYELNDPRTNDKELLFPQFYPIEESVEEIVSKKRSMARFGDGEFAIMFNEKRQKFQHLDDRLANRLREIIATNEDGFLIGIADNYGNLDKYNKGGKQGIRLYMTEEVRAEHWKYLDKNRVYHNAYISRPYALFADNTTDAPKHRFHDLRRIWNNRKILFVEGALTRLGVGNDLFDNAAQIRRIEAPPVNSFDKYDEILDAALKYAEDDTLFLIALGPSAGVLAYDLYRAGYQALDIGHVDLEYEWFLRGKGARCEVKNKYNNEFPGGDVVEDINDEEYLRQIVYVVGDDTKNVL